jgi:hypothetical protein
VGRKAQNAVTAVAIFLGALALALPLALAQLPLEPQHETGAGVTGAFEGWFRNSDGTYSLLLGYYNRNRNQEVDIPIGPQNQIEPGGPDQGQPTHFITGRDWGVFTIKVPADFGQKKLTWTLSGNGQVTSIPASLKTDWELSPFVEAAVGNTPPVLSFEEKGPSAQGPIGVTVERSAKVGVPLSLTTWVSDDAKFTSNSGARPNNLPGPVTIRWSVYRGEASVKFSGERPAVEKIDRPGAAFAGKATATATFSKPGDYILRVVANDYSGDGGGGFQCCWTNGQVRVSVRE